ncbi:MAG: hypothetical protein DMG42_34670 [Acidobacteria bacterium]|nr:MAG: hypothetical protein DMG42_34670 [Acidobacteriota bacterium]
MNRPLGPCSAPGRSDWRMGLQTLCFGGDGMERIACPSTKLGAKFSLQGVLRVPRLWLCPFLVTALMLAANGPLWAQSSTGASTYLDPKQPIEVRVNDLLSRMTLKEKVGQLNLPCVYVDELGKTIPDKMNACRRFAAGTYTSEIGPGCGFFTLADTILHEGPKQQAEYFNELQKIALTQTRLKIPLLQDEEGTHGAMFPGATIFPEGLAIGSTFDMPLVKSVCAAAAQEARSVGIHVLSTLVLELDRDPRMGRNEEAYTEDPYLYSRIAENIVQGAQGADIAAPDKVVALMTDFPTQSEPTSGLERGAIELSERSLRENFLPPWQAAITKSGALGVMAGYPEVEDVPSHGSEKWMNDVLREELGFKGIVVLRAGLHGTASRKCPRRASSDGAGGSRRAPCARFEIRARTFRAPLCGCGPGGQSYALGRTPGSGPSGRA